MELMQEFIASPYNASGLVLDWPSVASYISRYDPVTSPVEAAPFAPVSEALASATAWIAAEEGERLAFYSAAASDRPYRPSPGASCRRVDQETGEPIIPDGQSTAMTQALGTLSHLAAQADASDPSITTLGGVALGSRGASKRERLQEQLAQRSGSFLLQVSQQALRRLTPSEPVPTTRAELTARRPVFTLYAERFGEFGSQRGLGIMFWLLANILDALLSGDTAGAEEMAALALKIPGLGTLRIC
eukprot:s8411_g2.t1